MSVKGNAGAEVTDCDVAVIGAGLSGLVAARELTRQGHRVRVLEARDRIGGRIYTIDDHGHPVELGAAFVGPEQHAIRDLADEVGLSLFPTWDTGTHLGRLGNQTYRWSGSFPRVGARSSVSAAAAIGRLNFMARSVDPQHPWTARHAQKWDAVSVGQWLDRASLTPTARGLLSASLRSIFAADTESLSLLHVLMCIRSAGGFRKYMRASGAQQLRFTHGASALCHRIAADLHHQPTLNTPVRKIHDDGTVVHLATATQTLTAKRAVITVPPALANNIDLTTTERNPSERRRIWAQTSSGTVLKYHLFYPHPFWRDAGLSGKTLADTAVVNATFDHSTENEGILVAFVVGSQARELLSLDEDDRLAVILDDLAPQLGSSIHSPTRTHRHLWNNDPWSAGCFAAYLPPGTWTQHGKSHQQLTGRIHYAGTETATRYFGSMEGAVTAGQRVATEIAAHLTPSTPQLYG